MGTHEPRLEQLCGGEVDVTVAALAELMQLAKGLNSGWPLGRNSSLGSQKVG
jgi:hypothetical protein